MDQKDVRTKHINPALGAAGWEGADYLLTHRTTAWKRNGADCEEESKCGLRTSIF